MPRLPSARRVGAVGACPRCGGRRDDAGRVHLQVASVRVEGKLGVAGALHRPVPSTRRTDTGGSRPGGRVVLLRARRAKRHRRRRLGRCVEARLLRVGVQGPPRRPRRGLQSVAAVRARLREPAAADRLGHGAVPHPHQLDEQRERDPRVHARRSRRRRDSRQAQVGDVGAGAAASRARRGRR